MGKTFTEAYAMLKEVYGNECLSRTQVFEWFQRFKEGRETTEDDPRPGRHSTSKRTKTVKKLILHESFNMRKVCTKMVPKLPTPEQKESIMNICAEILNNIDTYPGWLDTVITCD
ncbi:hypothetical protein NQ318_017180 [Aromia moschata]|uniref:Mos1 transposase HTH domain-containing protein n=1 Tax=Aromia moschata TaxID=1265417 RepID=A0AAV8YP97_9CUCU|nr:hypothetical protein NQ318_017180 [Aromia moschata]